MNINHFVVSGNITRDLELRHLPSGTATVTYTVACNFVRHDDDGKKHERADFIPVTTFGKQAERDAQYLRKGSPVAVEGRIESWFNPEEKRGGFYFKARNVEYGGRGSAGDSRSDSNGSNGTAPSASGAGDADRASDEWLRSYDEAQTPFKCQAR